MYPHLLYCKFRKLIQKGEKTLPNKLCRFPKLLQEDLIRGCLGPKGHFLLEMLSLSLPWYQDRKQNNNNNWHSYCTQSFKITFTSNKKECKSNSPKSSPALLTNTPPYLARSNSGYKWWQRGSQKYRTRVISMSQSWPEARHCSHRLTYSM